MQKGNSFTPDMKSFSLNLASGNPISFNFSSHGMYIATSGKF